MLDLKNIEKYIECVNISNKFSNGFEELYNWVNSDFQESKYKLHIIQIRSNKITEDIYYHGIKNGLKCCYILKNKKLFMIGANVDVQFHILEAILEGIIERFNVFYSEKLKKYEGGIVSKFKEFDEKTFKIITSISEKVTLIRTHCPACNDYVKIYIKHSLIENPPKGYPVSVVYINKGHGLLLYIDANFKVRGSEIVDVTG